jgi:hypothetical protein
MFKRKISKKEFDAIVKSNPEQVKIHISSKQAKVGFFDIMIPKALIDYCVDVSVKIPKKELVDETKTGKICSHQIKQSGNWKNLKLPKYTTINLYVDDTNV